MNDGGPAFPNGGQYYGMTMRKYYKAKIMSKAYEYHTKVHSNAKGNFTHIETDCKQIAETCGFVADMMIAEDEAFEKKELKDE